MAGKRKEDVFWNTGKLKKIKRKNNSFFEVPVLNIKGKRVQI